MITACTVCGSQRVQVLHLIWVNENDGGSEFYNNAEFAGEADLYPDKTFCKDCEVEGRHPHPPLERKPG